MSAHTTSCYGGIVDYEPLPPCSIRVIVLTRGVAGEPLKAIMQSVCLEKLEVNKLTYNALSYHWSSDERTFPMVLNNKQIKITKPLGELFASCRNIIQGSDTSSWWVDQLCIDQESAEDKAQEIPKMRTIYEKATRVISWLNPTFEDSDRAIAHINRLGDWALSISSFNLVNDVPLLDILGQLDDEENMRDWRAVQRFMGHVYWDRAWIFPEATADLDTTLIVCGNSLDSKSVVFPTMRRVLWFRMVLRDIWANRPPPEYRIAEIESSLIGRVASFREMRHKPDMANTDLLDMLHIIRRTECSRPEDKIYAMLPFGADVGDFVDNPFIKPDYISGAARAYSDLVKWYITRHGNLNFLGYCTWPYSEWQICGPSLKVPSWVPNWTYYSMHEPLFKSSNPKDPIEDRAPLYSACGPYSHSLSIAGPITAGTNADRLLVSGVKVATIHQALGPAYVSNDFDPIVEQSWVSQLDKDPIYPLTGERYEDVIARTIVADTSWDAVKGGRVSRPGHGLWWSPDLGLTPQETARREYTLRSATRDRTLFFAGSRETPADPASSLFGLGPHNLQPADEVWALKGGSTLFVLRSIGGMGDTNVAKNGSESDSNFANIINVSGSVLPEDTVLTIGMYEFVGECYVHGLMDGEVMEYIDCVGRGDLNDDESTEQEDVKFQADQVEGVERNEETIHKEARNIPVALKGMSNTFSDICLI